MAQGTAPDGNASLFRDVHFTIVKSESLGSAQAARLQKDLEQAGGTYHDLSDSSLDQITHIIADSPDFSAYDDACDAFLHVVRPLWVEHSITRSRLANTRQYRPDPRLILSDTIVVVAGDIPEGDKDAIIGGVQAMGGQFSTVMTKLVTHVVALSMDNPQCQLIVDKQLSCRPVLPHWFDHCLTLGKKIDCGPYVLPDPSILSSEGAEAELKDKTKYLGNIDGLKDASLLDPRLPEPVSPSKTRKELSVFSCKKVMLAQDLDLKPHLEKSIESLIQKGHGSLVDNVEDADMLICRYRSGLDFREAMDSGKDIGNLNWLYHLINTNRYSSPLRKLLHYPIPKKPLVGFEKFQISVSNYTGEARVYLESLIRAAGGTFTKTMTQNNTHLITAHSMSEKVDAAREWSISTVNHLWLEESFARCKPQALTCSRYTTFPSRTNLGEVIGQTQLDRKLLEDHYLPHRQALAEPPIQSKSKDGIDDAKTPARHTSGSMVTPAANDKENVTPGSRGAKDRAISKLHQLAPDIAAFQKEMKRKGGVVFGGRRVTDPERVPLRPSNGERKRSADQAPNHELGDQSPPEPKRKRSTKTNVPAQSASAKPLKLVVTGGKKMDWYEQNRANMKELGMRELVNVPLDGKIDALVAYKVMRTPNFLAAVAAGVPVVSPAWIEETVKHGSPADMKKHALKDKQWEAEVGVSMSDVLERARTGQQNGRLFRGDSIYSTDHIRSDMTVIDDIVQRNGGLSQHFRGRAGQLQCSDSKTQEVFLLSTSKDSGIWASFQRAARSSGLTARIVDKEWLLQVVLTQNRDCWDDAWALD